MSSESEPDGNGGVDDLFDDEEGPEDADDDSNAALLIVLAIVAVVVLPIVAVAVTVIGSAVIGAFVLGLGEEPPAQPQMELAFDETSAGVQITHQGGDAVRAGALVVSVGGEERSWAAIAGVDPEDQVMAGDAVTVSASSGDLIRVTWRNGDGSTTVGVYQVEGTTSPVGSRSLPVAAPA